MSFISLLTKHARFSFVFWGKSALIFRCFRVSQLTTIARRWQTKNAEAGLLAEECKRTFRFVPWWNWNASGDVGYVRMWSVLPHMLAVWSIFLFSSLRLVRLSVCIFDTLYLRLNGCVNGPWSFYWVKCIVKDIFNFLCWKLREWWVRKSSVLIIVYISNNNHQQTF